MIVELKLPPADAYHKLRHTLEEVNALIAAYAPGGVAATAGEGGHQQSQLDPALGNVCFASGTGGWSFTLHTWAQLYVQLHGVPFDPAMLAKRLWGDLYFHPDTRTFKRKAPEGGGERSFVQFVLEPLYKLYSQVSEGHTADLMFDGMYSSVLQSLMV